MAKKREKIKVYPWNGQQNWCWDFWTRAWEACSEKQNMTKPAALRSARAFADKFKVPPDVVEDE